MDKHLISIVLPSYNGSCFLRQSINSILDQTYQDWELILVDDCSTDATWLIMQEYQNNYPDKILCIHHKTNKKLPAALNTGFAASKGEYLTWTSDDNYYEPDAIEEMVNYLDKNLSIGLVYCDFTIISDQEEFIPVSVLPPESLMFRSMIGACFLYRRVVYEEIGNYSEEHFLAEDYEFFVRVALKFTISPLHKNLYYYRQHSTSLTNTRTKDVEQAVDKIKLEYARKMPFIVSAKVKSEGYHRLYRRFTKKRHFSDAIKSYFLMVKYDPMKIFEIKSLIKSILREIVLWLSIKITL